jgi:hypothetical protein
MSREAQRAYVAQGHVRGSEDAPPDCECRTVTVRRRMMTTDEIIAMMLAHPLPAEPNPDWPPADDLPF